MSKQFIPSQCLSCCGLIDSCRYIDDIETKLFCGYASDIFVNENGEKKLIGFTFIDTSYPPTYTTQHELYVLNKKNNCLYWK